MDKKQEYHLQEYYIGLLNNKTILIAMNSHLNLLKYFDKIIILQNGLLANITHKESISHD